MTERTRHWRTSLRRQVWDLVQEQERKGLTKQEIAKVLTEVSENLEEEHKTVPFP